MSAVLKVGDAGEKYAIEVRKPDLADAFDLLATAPHGVKRLRELILSLAVKGKLVRQANNSESVAALLARIQKNKAAAIESGRVKRQKPLRRIDASEVPFEIPKSWQWVRLGEITNFGTTDKSGEVIDRTWVLDLEDIEKDTSKILQRRSFAERRSLSDKNCFLAGDVLYGKLRPYLNKVVVADAPGVCTTEILPFRCFAEVEPKYFQTALRSPYFLDYVNRKSYGMKMPRLGTEDGRNALIPMPSVVEQRSIVARVGELMELCDSLEEKGRLEAEQHARLTSALFDSLVASESPQALAENWQRVAEHFDLLLDRPEAVDALERTILELAVRGLLVEQDAEDEPANELLQKIALKKQLKIAAKEVRQGKVSRPQSASNAPDRLPSGWQWVNVDALCFKVTDGTHFTPHYVESGVRFVSAKDIVGGALVFNRCRYISKDEHEKLYRRCNPEYHDIVISKSGSIGTVALVQDHDEFSLFESLALLKFDQTALCPTFLVHALSHACGSLTAEHIRGVGVKHLHLDMLRGLELAIPPLAEQRRIVARLNELREHVGRLRQCLTSKARAQSLLAGSSSPLF